MGNSDYSGSFTPEELTAHAWKGNPRVFEDAASFLREADDYCGSEHLEFNDRVGRFLWIFVPIALVAGVIWLVAKGTILAAMKVTKVIRRDS